MPRPEDLLPTVDSREKLIAFIQALASEREAAEEEERANPGRYRLDGARGWSNGDISGFLFASLEYFSPTQFRTPESEPSWQMIADLLYFGKIYE